MFWRNLEVCSFLYRRPAMLGTLTLATVMQKKDRYLPFMPPPPPYPSQFPHPPPLTIVALHLYPLNHRSTMRTLIFKLFFVIPITVSGILHPQPDNILLI